MNLYSVTGLMAAGLARLPSESWIILPPNLQHPFFLFKKYFSIFWMVTRAIELWITESFAARWAVQRALEGVYCPLRLFAVDRWKPPPKTTHEKRRAKRRRFLCSRSSWHSDRADGLPGGQVGGRRWALHRPRLAANEKRENPGIPANNLAILLGS